MHHRRFAGRRVGLMATAELERYLHAHIPLSRAMQVRVAALAAERATLSAPLAPNINHRETVFGGSASAVAILAAWSLLHARLALEAVECRLVIQRNTMTYLRPIAAEFSATAVLADESRWPRFLATLRRRGKARISLSADLESAGQAVGHFEGDFVATDLKRSS